MVLCYASGDNHMEEQGASVQVNSNEGQLSETDPQLAGSQQSRGVRYGPIGSAWRRTTPTVLTWRDLADLPRQILPEETYRHCQNARSEAALALFSLWKNINKSSKGSSGHPRRRRIEVE